jgi:signal transduction histidine kinase
MRGGLGKTLLTAFLILSIGPLSVISAYIALRERRATQREVTNQLSSVAAMAEARVHQWTDQHTAHLHALATLYATSEEFPDLPSALEGEGSPLRQQLLSIQAHDPAFERLAVVGEDGRIIVCTDREIEGKTPGGSFRPPPGSSLNIEPAVLDPTSSADLIVAQEVSAPPGDVTGWLVGWLDMDDLAQFLGTVEKPGRSSTIYLVDGEGFALPQGERVNSPGVETALDGRDVAGLYTNYAGTPVIGVYRWMPELGLALVAEQAQEEAFASTDTVTATVIGATLVVALVTAIIAAVVTRQITRPIVRLTEFALHIAEGNLEQQVPITSRDEIGILTYVFNRMAADLKALYDDLEKKVAQRTALLQKANYQIQRRAIQLAATVEVSQAATSILDPDQLLQEVVQLVHDRFAYSYVGVYQLEEERILLQKSTGGGEKIRALKGEPLSLGDPCALSEAARTCEPAIVTWNAEEAEARFSSSYIRAEAALPLKMGGRVIGVLDILSTDSGQDFDEDTISVLQNVANQITIALQNAQAYAQARKTAERLHELDTFRSQFLANMSHELREPLTNIIGFSRLILKGLDGPITEQQQHDLQIIYANSQHLLGLINDLLDISQIEAGMMELQFQRVDLKEIIRSVMATTSALVRDKDVALIQRLPVSLPPIKADPTRIRQVLLHLLNNAAQSTDEGHIAIAVRQEDQELLVSVEDTGPGINPADQQHVFDRFENGQLGNAVRPGSDGLGLALSKEFVEMHGGKIWVTSTSDAGTSFFFTLPLAQETDATPS